MGMPTRVVSTMALLIASSDSLRADEPLTLDRIALNPSYAHQYLSSVVMTMGRFDEAVRAARHAQALDPLSMSENTTLGVRLYNARQFDAASDALEHTLRINPDFAVAHWGPGETRRELQQHEAAMASLRRAVSLSGNSAHMRAWLAHELASAGRRDEALAIRADLERLASGRYVSPFLCALMASGFHGRADTLAWLRRVRDARSGWMPFLKVEPEFVWLAADPSFSACRPKCDAEAAGPDAGRLASESQPRRMAGHVTPW